MLNIGLGLAKDVSTIARRAGVEIMKVYQTDFEVEEKKDNSPVTKADRIAEELISRAILEGITAKFPIIAEEAANAGNIVEVGSSPFWLVDPLDGTKEFVKKNGEFTVNIALIEHAKPVLGVVHLPDQDLTYCGLSMGSFKFSGSEPRKEIKCRNQLADGLVVISSRSHGTPVMDTYLSEFSVAQIINAGSSLKFCRIAEGSADIYPRFGQTMEWDTAAGQAVLHFAGGTVKTTDGSALKYGKPGFKNPHFIAAGPGIVNN